MKLFFHMNDTSEAAYAWMLDVLARGVPTYRGHEIVPVWHGGVGFRVVAGAHVFRGWTFSGSPGAVWYYTVEDAMNAVDVYEETKDVPWVYSRDEASPFWKIMRERYPVKDSERRLLAALRAEIDGMTFATVAQERRANEMLDVIERCEAGLLCACDPAETFNRHRMLHVDACPVARVMRAQKTRESRAGLGAKESLTKSTGVR